MMKVMSCMYNLAFQPIADIRRLAFDIEDRLAGYVKPFTLPPVPNEAPLEFPRIVAQAESGNSNLFVSGYSAQIQSQYDTQYDATLKKDTTQCLNHSKANATALYEALAGLLPFRFSFMGAEVKLCVPSEECGGDPASFIHNSYLKTSSDLTLADARAKVVYAIDNEYYLNIEVEKQELGDGLPPFQVGPFVAVEKKENVLAVSVDFNNRLAFNQGHPPVCNPDTIELLYERLDDFLNNGFNLFLEEGVVRF